MHSDNPKTGAELAPAVFRLGLLQEEQDARSTGVVEEVFGQVDDAFDQVLIDKALADQFLRILVGVATAGRPLPTPIIFWKRGLFRHS